MKITIQRAKLLLAGSLIRETQAIYTAHLVKIRLKETAEGDRTGLFGNCLDILEEWNASHIWEKATTQKKTKWKEIVKSAARKHQSTEWLKFAKKNSQNLQVSSYRNGEVKPTSIYLTRAENKSQRLD